MDTATTLESRQASYEIITLRDPHRMRRAGKSALALRQFDHISGSTVVANSRAWNNWYPENEKSKVIHVPFILLNSMASIIRRRSNGRFNTGWYPLDSTIFFSLSCYRHQETKSSHLAMSHMILRSPLDLQFSNIFQSLSAVVHQISLHLFPFLQVEHLGWYPDE